MPAVFLPACLPACILPFVASKLAQFLLAAIAAKPSYVANTHTHRQRHVAREYHQLLQQQQLTHLAAAAQRSTLNVQHATFNVQRSTYNAHNTLTFCRFSTIFNINCKQLAGAQLLPLLPPLLLLLGITIRLPRLPCMQQK